MSPSTEGPEVRLFCWSNVKRKDRGRIEKTETGFPFLDRIHAGKLADAIKTLAECHAMNHPEAEELDIVKALRIYKETGYWPSSQPDVVAETPDWDEEHIEELNREMSQKPRGQACPPELSSGGREKVE